MILQKLKTFIKYVLINTKIVPGKVFERTRTHWLRVVSHEASMNMIQNISTELSSVLEISGNRWENYFKKLNYKSMYYPEFDIQKINSFSNTYDLIIIEHVLEHLIFPFKAMKNIYSLLNNNGYVLIITPFLVKIHNAPQDCTRWTETGMKYFLVECGFRKENIVTGSWGNRSCVKANFNKWIKFNPLFHSLVNDPEYPITIWAFAQK